MNKSLPACLCVLAFVLIATSLSATGEDRGAEKWSGGIWKSQPLPKNANAEFDNQDPYALAIGTHIKTDCSIRWISHDPHRMYCFNSLTSKSFFLDNPERYIGEARAFLAGSKKP